MHLRSITLKGFKSFPNRTRLEFAPGIAVIIGPNGSGKSNITDAVLWALGEQSPLAVRGQTMQDVIFAGGHGVPSRKEAEVEVVIDNSDVEREARSRLKPLKRQAEAAELHARLARQSREARYELARERAREVGAQLAAAEKLAAAARAQRDEGERLLDDVAKRREAAEES